MNPQRRVLTGQLCLLGACVVGLLQFALSFPFPGPMVRPFLGPQDRWPEAQVKQWAEASRLEPDVGAKADHFRPDFWEYFTRDPDRVIPTGDGVLVAPADGLFRYHDKRDGKQFVVIALSFWDVHVQRFPCDGVVTKVEDVGDEYMDAEGKDLVYLQEKVSPVQKVVTMTTKWGEFKIRLITSLAATRLAVFVEAGAEVKRGQRLGKILAGSTVVLEMPDSIALDVELNTHVLGGETILHRGKRP